MSRDIEQYSPGTGRRLKEDNSTINIANKISEMLAEIPPKRISSTSAITPDEGNVFIAIQAEEDTVINACLGQTHLDGASVLAEGIRYGRFTSIQLTSGVVIAYQGI